MKTINKMQPGGGVQLSCLNNKGFAISGIMYAILIVSLLLVVGTLKTLQNRKTIIDRLKSETVNALDIKNYEDLVIALENLDTKVTDLEANSTLADRVTELENNNKALTTRITTLENGFLNKTYPVGSIYISINNTNPSQLFGGTWEQIGQGRTLIGAGTNGGYTFTAGSIGTTVGATTNPLGEYVHTLSVAEMPSHTHNFHSHNYSSTTPDSPVLHAYYAPAEVSSGGVIALIPRTGTNYNSWGVTMLNTGGSRAHNNIQPYIVTYMWKRTS